MKKNFLLWLLFVPLLSQAQLRLPAMVSSGMVMQQNESTALHGWGGPGSWVYITTSWNNQTDSAKVTNFGKWSVDVKTPGAGGPHSIKIRNERSEILLSNILIGELWVCSGQSNMEWSYRQGLKDIIQELPKAYNANIRLFHIPKTASQTPQDDVQGKWMVCDSVSLKDFSAVGYFFGKQLQNQLQVPVGLIDASWGGTPAETWLPASLVENNNTLKVAAGKLQQFDWWPSTPGAAYNGMIHALTGYKIAGAIWYQGESNVGTNSSYAELMRSLIDSWRSAWKKEIKFYLVQIAPYDYGNTLDAALLREAQHEISGYPGTGMISIPDLVDNIKDIHPVNKHDVGLRLANLALGDHYGKMATGFRNPVITQVQKNKNKLYLSFNHAESGITINGKKVTGLYISGPDESWQEAEARIENNVLVVWNKKLKNPEYIRYGFGNMTIGNLFSGNGLPVAPFRNDHWNQIKLN